MQTYVIRRRSGWANSQELEIASGRSTRVGLEMAGRVKWLRSYVVQEDDDRLGTVCIYQGIDEAAIREHASRAGMPADEVNPVVNTVVLDEDLVTA
jgi:hypothetical protein